MKKISAVVTAMALLVSTGTATMAASDQAALSPGKPAGVKQAALHAPLWVWIAGIGFVALGIGLVASGNGNGSSGGTSSTTHL